MKRIKNVQEYSRRIFLILSFTPQVSRQGKKRGAELERKEGPRRTKGSGGGDWKLSPNNEARFLEQKWEASVAKIMRRVFLYVRE